MTTRPLEERDLPILQSIYNGLDYAFDDGFPDFLSDQYEAAEVVVDANDVPLMVVGAKKAVEMVMICNPNPPVIMRMQGIALLHARMQEILSRLGYKDASASIPPSIVETHGRTMQKRFGWLKAWPTYRIGKVV